MSGIPVQFDGAVHREIRAGAAGERASEPDVHFHRPVPHCGIHPGDDALDDTVAGVHERRLAGLDVARLRFGDPQHRLQFLRIGNPREVLPGIHLLADFDGNLQQDSDPSGPHREGRELTPAECQHRPIARHRRFLGRELRLAGIGKDGETLLFERVAGLELFDADLAAPVDQFPDESRLEELPVGVGVPPGLCRGGRQLPGGVLLFQQIGSGLIQQPAEFRFLGAELEFGVPGLLLELQVREDEQHGVRLDGRPGKNATLLNASAGLRGQPADLFGGNLQTAGAAHLPHEFAPLDNAGPDDGAVHLGDPGSDPAEQDQERRQRGRSSAGEDQPPDTAFPVPVGDLEVHGLASPERSLFRVSRTPTPATRA